MTNSVLIGVIFFSVVVVFILLFLPIRWCKNVTKFRSSYFIFCTLSKFKSHIDRKTAAEALKIIKGTLDKNNIPFWLSEGTALGVMRERTLIPWDDDVDIGVRGRYLKKFIKRVIPSLKKKKVFFVGSWPFLRKKALFLKFKYKNLTIDFDFVTRDGSCMACRTSHAKCTSCSELIPHIKSFHEVYFDEDSIEGKILRDLSFKIPKESYYLYLYGKDWKTPMKQSAVTKATALAKSG